LPYLGKTGHIGCGTGLQEGNRFNAGPDRTGLADSYFFSVRMFRQRRVPTAGLLIDWIVMCNELSLQISLSSDLLCRGLLKTRIPSNIAGGTHGRRSGFTRHPGPHT
jgi:hypothetical protein